MRTLYTRPASTCPEAQQQSMQGVHTAIACMLYIQNTAVEVTLRLHAVAVAA